MFLSFRLIQKSIASEINPFYSLTFYFNTPRKRQKPCRLTTCVPRWEDVETVVSTSLQRGIHVVCLLGNFQEIEHSAKIVEGQHLVLIISNIQLKFYPYFSRSNLIGIKIPGVLMYSMQFLLFVCLFVCLFGGLYLKNEFIY